MFLRAFSRFARRSRLPEGVRIYAVGDLHGCADLLSGAFDVIDADLARSRPGRCIEVFLGDYIDRGPDTRLTLDLLIERRRLRETVFVRGNHESILTSFLDEPRFLASWGQLGGLATLASYGLAMSADDLTRREQDIRNAFAAALPSTHNEFLIGLVPSFTCGDFFFTHAGVRPGVSLGNQSEHDLMWIREPFLSSERSFGKMVVHGHTPVREPDVRSSRINIDTGAYATGKLTVLAIEDDRLEFHFSTRSHLRR